MPKKRKTCESPLQTLYLNHHARLRIGNEFIERVNVSFQNNLKWNAHVEEITRKANAFTILENAGNRSCQLELLPINQVSSLLNFYCLFIQYSTHSGILCSYVLGTVYVELSWVVRSARLLSKRDLVIF